jgi:hypothetical protein
MEIVSDLNCCGKEVCRLTVQEPLKILPRVLLQLVHLGLLVVLLVLRLVEARKADVGMALE